MSPTAADFWNGAVINVGEVYASLARDISAGSFNTPGFAHARHSSRLIAAVERAAQTGARQRNLGGSAEFKHSKAIRPAHRFGKLP